MFGKKLRAVIDASESPGPFMHLEMLSQVSSTAEAFGTVLLWAKECWFFGVSSQVVIKFGFACEHEAALIVATFEQQGLLL